MLKKKGRSVLTRKNTPPSSFYRLSGEIFGKKKNGGIGSELSVMIIKHHHPFSFLGGPTFPFPPSMRLIGTLKTLPPSSSSMCASDEVAASMQFLETTIFFYLVLVFFFYCCCCCYCWWWLLITVHEISIPGSVERTS